jgi:hypothetical protein
MVNTMFYPIKFGQILAGVLHLAKNLMSFLLSAQRAVACCLLLAVTTALVHGQTNYAAQGNEYPVIGTLPSDQVFPSVSVNSSGGYIVWQDNITDGDGWGISARRLDATWSGTASAIRVNANGTNDQIQPVVAMLPNGGAAFVWQGGKQSFQHAYARFLSAAGTWVTGDVMVNAVANVYQRNPAIAVLTNGTAVIAYASYNQASANSLQDVYFQRMSTNGTKLGSEVLVNQTTAFNQRTPAVAALADGRFVMVWVSEQQRSAYNPGLDYTNGASPNQIGVASVDIYARFFSPNGTALTNEFLVNTSVNVCANPSVAAASDGSFAIAWSEKSLSEPTNGWDISARVFSNAGVGGTVRRVNNFTYGDQFAPTISADGANGWGYMLVWTSLGEDGSREGVFGRFMNPNGTFPGAEFRVNTTTVSQQMHPTVASDGHGRFLAVWTSFVGGAGQFDLYAQRYASTLLALSAPNPPFVTVLSSNALSVSWPPVAGLSVANYEVYADGAASATAVITSNNWTMTGLVPSSTHSFRLDYVLADGRRSPLSGATANTTYGTLMWGGIPYEWMTAYFGSDVFSWPAPGADSDGDGVSNLQEFMAGTIPTNSASVLRSRLDNTSQGLFLKWNTEPGLMYQVQTTTDLSTWSNLGGVRFAAGHLDSMFVGGDSVGYYRIIRLR